MCATRTDTQWKKMIMILRLRSPTHQQLLPSLRFCIGFCVDWLVAMLPMETIFVSLFYIRLKKYFVYSNENNNKFDFQLISVATVLCTKIFYVYFYIQVKLNDNGVDFGKIRLENKQQYFTLTKSTNILNSYQNLIIIFMIDN